MMIDLANQPIGERQEHLLAVISSKAFLKMEHLGNEVPFFICPFKPDEYQDMSDLYVQLYNKLQKN